MNEGSEKEIRILIADSNESDVLQVVTLLRDIITDQQQFNKRTKEQQKDRVRSLFQD